MSSVELFIEDLEYERALQQVARCKTVAKGPEEAVALLLYEGVILAELIKDRQSDAAFRAALALNPDAKLPLKVSPKLRRRFEAVCENVLGALAVRGDNREALKMAAPASPQGVQASQAPLPAGDLAMTGASSELVPEVSGSRSSLRDRALIPAVAGGTLVVAAGVFWRLADVKKARMEDADPALRSRDDVKNVASGVRGLQTASVGFLMGGLVGLGAATGMYLLGTPEPSLSLSLGTDGTSAFVSGRWP